MNNQELNGLELTIKVAINKDYLTVKQDLLNNLERNI